MTRKWVWGTIIAIFLVILAAMSISAYVGWSLTHPPKQEVYETPAKYGLRFESVAFESRQDKLKLKGWFIKADKPNGMTLIVAHGYKKNRLQDDVPLMPMAKSLTQRGYQMLLFDLRNSGESEGELTTVGEREKWDVLGAIDYIERNHPGQIGLIGYSMGGATSLLAAAEAPQVSAVIADSAFSNLSEYLSDNLSFWSGLPEFPFTPLILWMMPPATGANPDSVVPFEAISKVYPRPILFIHGKADDAIPYQNSVRMAKTHPERFDLLLTEGADHVGSYEKNPDGYVEQVDAFFRKVLTNP